MALIENEWYIEAPWGRIALIAWGECWNPPVLLVHGKQDCASSFRPLVALLPRNFYYISIDLPGNGRSDTFPQGLPFSTNDLLYALKVVIDHFRWDKLFYIGHSLGTLLGKHYELIYPGKFKAVVDLDPVPGYYTVEADDFEKWYYKFFTKYFDDGNYKKFNMPKETAPKYTYEKAFELLKNNRVLTDEATKHAIERVLEPAGDGLYRFTFDSRMRLVSEPVFTRRYLEELYNSIKTPTLTVVAQIIQPLYQNADYLFHEQRNAERNNETIVIEGHHDFHLDNPEKMAGKITEFILRIEGSFKSKL